MSPREIQINRILAANQGNPYVAPALAAELGQLQTERTTRQSEANQLYKAKVEQQTKLVEMRQTQLADQAKRQQDYAKQAQGLIAGGLPGAPGAPSAAGQAVDPRLGTPLSPQRSGIPTVPPVPPGITPDKWNEQQAPEMTKAIVAYEKAVPAFEEAVKTLRLARDHPGKEWGVGPLSGYAKKMPGTAAYGFGTIMDQIAGKNFLNAYQQLKGGGAITEIEGSKAEQAQARLATAQTKEDFDKALNDFESNLRQDLETVQRKVNRPVTSWRPPNDNVSTAPDIGQRRGNKEYIGGNPADPMSWRPAQ
jgi:hypothetical protein